MEPVGLELGGEVGRVGGVEVGELESGGWDRGVVVGLKLP